MTRRSTGRTAQVLPVSRPPNEGWEPARSKPLRGQVVVVAGGTRGAGRAIAVSFGLAGATAYVTGPSVPGHPATPGRPETIPETAQMIRGNGGRAVPVRVNPTDAAAVRRLFERVRREQDGRLDLLVNDIRGGEELTEWGLSPWKLSWDLGRTMLDREIFTHILTSRYGVPLLVRRQKGIVFEITDGDHPRSRGSLFYDLANVSVIRLALALHEEFEEAKLRGLSAIALTPGFLRSEFMLEQFGVTEANGRDPARARLRFAASETP